MSGKGSEDRRKSGGWVELFVVVLIGLAVGCAWWSYMEHARGKWADSAGLTKLGQIGDTFGSLNTLFSGLAFIALAYTIRRQHLDGLASEDQHHKVLQAEERIAKINALTAVIDYSRGALERISERNEKASLLLGYQLTVLAGHGEAGFFIAEVTKSHKDGCAFVREATSRIGPIDLRTTIGEVRTRLSSFIGPELSELVNLAHIHNHRLTAALAELEKLAEPGIPELPRDVVVATDRSIPLRY